MRRAIVLALTLALVAVVIPASAALAAKPVPVGERINVLVGEPTEFAADTPFHVMHGWGLEAGDRPPGKFGFDLDLDGVSQGPGRFIRDRAGDADLPTRWFLFDFEDGLPPGVYTFTGHWYAPCRWATDNFGYTDPCPSRNAAVEVFTAELEVVFDSEA